MNKYQCSCAICGRDLSREVINRTAARYEKELNELLSQPNPDRGRIAFLTLLLSVLGRRSAMMEEKAS